MLIQSYLADDAVKPQPRQRGEPRTGSRPCYNVHSPERFTSRLICDFLRGRIHNSENQRNLRFLDTRYRYVRPF
jgi:hypothetical protein